MSSGAVQGPLACSSSKRNGAENGLKELSVGPPVVENAMSQQKGVTQDVLSELAP